jgi:hypothetical protein
MEYSQGEDVWMFTCGRVNWNWGCEVRSFSIPRLQACHHARLRKGRWAAPAPLRGPCGVLDPACAWRLGGGVGTGNVLFGVAPCRWQVEQGMSVGGCLRWEACKIEGAR